MSEYDNTSSGALFKNDKKESDNHPDYRGSINVAGTDYWLSAWIKKSKAGQTFMSLSVKPKDAAPPKPYPTRAGNGAPDDDIPF
jgi:uncharacterized protein (DUF736 family)